MTNKRVVNESPSFALIQKPDEIAGIIKEIERLKPKAEITLEGSGELASAKIIGWDPTRKFFTVKWNKKTSLFDEKLESESGLRAFFKVILFSKVLVFKSTTVRRLEDGTYHYRIPDQLYQQQRRAALRVPIDPGLRAYISTPIGDFQILDMSVGGARIEMPSSLGRTVTLGASYAPANFSIASNRALNPIEFTLKISHAEHNAAGCRFLELKKTEQALIKQFLVEALHVYFEKNLKAKTTTAGATEEAKGIKASPGGKAPKKPE